MGLPSALSGRYVLLMVLSAAAMAAKPVTRAFMSDTTQSEPSGVAAQITRGVQRFMLQAGLVSLTEVVLPDGHRADIMALDKKGRITIVEVKSSLADFRSDQKWHAYKDFC